MSKINLSYVDLFAGAGGWSVGFETAGFEHEAMYDHNRSACQTAEANFRTRIECVDLSRPSRLTFPNVDVVVGSPPCQGFSNEGKKDPDDVRNGLVWAFIDAVEQIRPRAWVFENVPGFQRSYGGKWFRALAARLNSSEYQWSHHVLDSADYGVPQHRSRFIILAARDFRPMLPVPTYGETGGLFRQKSYVSLWDAISDLPVAVRGDRVGTFEYEHPPLSDYQQWCRKGSARIFNHTAQNHSARVLEKIRAVPLGGGMLNFIDDYQENSVHYMGGYRRAPKDRPSWTAYWTRGMTSIHPEQHRFLTPRECARIQSFPDRFRFMGTTIENYTQVCNAVPPLLAEAIALALANQIVAADRRLSGCDTPQQSWDNRLVGT